MLVHSDNIYRALRLLNCRVQLILCKDKTKYRTPQDSALLFMKYYTNGNEQVVTSDTCDTCFLKPSRAGGRAGRE